MGSEGFYCFKTHTHTHTSTDSYQLWPVINSNSTINANWGAQDNPNLLTPVFLSSSPFPCLLFLPFSPSHFFFTPPFTSVPYLSSTMLLFFCFLFVIFFCSLLSLSPSCFSCSLPSFLFHLSMSPFLPPLSLFIHSPLSLSSSFPMFCLRFSLLPSSAEARPGGL